MTDISGRCDPGFEPVRAAFEDNFARGEEQGARFTLSYEGSTVVDLWAGTMDRKREKPWGPDTLAPVFSTTKALAALLIARLVEAGKLDYRQFVREVWPEFGQAAKAWVTVEQVMSHEAGLPGFLEPMDPALWFDWDAICAKLAAMSPMWKPGDVSGYHAITFGYLAGEIFRRVDGRTMGTALREDIAEPCGLDLWIGLPESEDARVADMQRPSALPQLGEVTDVKRAAFLTPWAAPGGRTGAEWRRAEIPSANGHATAESLARLMGALAGSGELDDVHILKPETVAAMSASRWIGEDLVLPFTLSWGAGVMRNPPNGFYGPGMNTFGHSGWGGSCAFADPDWGVAGAYVMNRQDVHLMGDPRSRRLINAAYAVVRSRKLRRQKP